MAYQNNDPHTRFCVRLQRTIIANHDGLQTSGRKPSISIGFDFERYAVDEGFRLIAGVDEVGRGCLAGPSWLLPAFWI